MALKDTWIDKVDEVDDILAEDINDIAHSAIESEKNRLDKVTTKGSLRAYGVDEAGNQIIFPVTKKNDVNSLAMTDDYGNLKSFIPREDYDVVNKIYADNTFANGLRGKKSGVAVSMDDIAQSSIAVVNTRSKNLIPYPYYGIAPNATVTRNGVTFTDNGDGSITAKGTATESTGFNLFWENSSNNNLAVGVPLVISSGVKNEDNSSACQIIVAKITTGGSAVNFMKSPSQPIGKLENGEYLKQINLYISSGTTVDTTIYPQLEYGTVATPYEPYVADDTPITVKSCGKNILQYPYYETTKIKNGVTFTVNGDGSVTVKGTPTAYTAFNLRYHDANIPVGVPVAISGGMGSESTRDRCFVIARRILADGTNSSFIQSPSFGSWDPVSSQLGEGEELVQIMLYVYEGDTVDCTIYPQLEVGTVATDYEPYIEGETIETTLADGAELASIAPNMTITTDNNGIMLDVEYKRDTNIAFEKLEKRLLSLETAIATT